MSEIFDQTDDSSAQKTKDAIRRLLKMTGPRQAGDLAEELNLSAMAVRQHLYQLQDQALVEATSEPGGVGRPAKLWALTKKSDGFFSDSHADLTVDLIKSVKQAFGDEGMERILEIRSKQQIAIYRKALKGAKGLKSQLTRLAKIRAREGYMAEVVKEEGVLYLVENHCPVCFAAEACTGLCAHELKVFQTVLGKGVRVERTQHILDGARRCAYRIEALT